MLLYKVQFFKPSFVYSFIDIGSNQAWAMQLSFLVETLLNNAFNQKSTNVKLIIGKRKYPSISKCESYITTLPHVKLFR